MTKQDKANAIAVLLEKFYPSPPIPLDHKDAYTLLIAVLLSAQCTDVRVNKITPLLFERADNPWDMAELSVDEIREVIKPCGLSPQKSKAIHRLSQMVNEEYGGEIPRSLEELENRLVGPSIRLKDVATISHKVKGKALL